MSICWHSRRDPLSGQCLYCGDMPPMIRQEDGTVSPPPPKPTGRITYAVDSYTEIARRMKSMGLNQDEGASK